MSAETLVAETLAAEAMAYAEKVTPEFSHPYRDSRYMMLGTLRTSNRVRQDVVDAALRHLAERVAKAEAARDRLQKLFDDAGKGEHNVLALIDHYQARVFEEEDKTRRAFRLVESVRAQRRMLRDAVGFAMEWLKRISRPTDGELAVYGHLDAKLKKADAMFADGGA